MNKEKYIIVSDDLYEDAKEKLKSLGLKVIPTFNSPNVSPHLAKHADMQIVKIDDTTYLSCGECYDYYKDILKEKNITLLKGEKTLGRTYPDDIAYNVVATKKYAVHNFKYTDPLLKNLLQSRQMINVSQGYSSCTLAKVSDDAFITSDEGIYKTFLENNINVLKITCKNILLPGFNYGFIGGATFRINDNLLCINGDINYLEDKDKIINYLKKFNVEIISLSDKRPLDIGSAVLVY